MAAVSLAAACTNGTNVSTDTSPLTTVPAVAAEGTVMVTVMVPVRPGLLRNRPNGAAGLTDSTQRTPTDEAIEVSNSRVCAVAFRETFPPNAAGAGEPVTVASAGTADRP